jgi:transcriptional pleiotropic regulator of transition state genes
MKATGITRPVDPLGRIVLPIELRKTLNIKDQDTMEIFVQNDMIILRKYQPLCGVCKESGDLIEGLARYGIKICKSCYIDVNSQEKRSAARKINESSN